MAKNEHAPGIFRSLTPTRLPATIVDVAKALQPLHYGRSLERRYGKRLKKEDLLVAQKSAEAIYGDSLLSYEHLDHAWHGMAFRVYVKTAAGEVTRVIKPQYSTEPPSENFWYPPTHKGKEDLEQALDIMRKEANLLGLNQLVTPTNVYLVDSPLGKSSSERGRKRGRYAHGKDVLVMEQPFVHKVSLNDVPAQDRERILGEYMHVLEFATNLYSKHGILIDAFGGGNLVLADTEKGIHWVLIDTAPVPPDVGPGTELIVTTWMALRDAKTRWELRKRPVRRKAV